MNLQVAAIASPIIVAVVGAYFGYRRVVREGEQRRGVEERSANLAELQAVNKALHEEIERVRADYLEDREEFRAFREEFDNLHAEMRWLRRDRADQIRRDAAWHNFGAAIVLWIETWMPQAIAMGLRVTDPPKPPNMPQLVPADAIDPDGDNPGRRWSDERTHKGDRNR